MPCHNGGLYVADALRSVLAQSRPPDEIILVDDGSTDDSAMRVREFGDKVVYRRQQRQGVSAARNRGVALSDGDVLAFLDADDLWPPDSLTLRLALLETDPSAGYVFGSVERFYSADLEKRMRGALSAASHLAGRLAGAMLIRRSTWDRVGGFDPGLKAGEMVEWVARAAMLGVTSRSTKERVLERRIHARNSVHRRDEYRSAHLHALRAALRLKKAAS